MAWSADVTASAQPFTAVVCANLIVERDAILFVRESKQRALGRWSLPGGGLEPGESMAGGAAREALEETGLVVEVGDLIGIYHCPSTLEGGAAVQFVFHSTVVGGALRRTVEHPAVEFLSRSEIADLASVNMIRGQQVLRAIKAFDAGARLNPDLVEQVEASEPPIV